MLYSIVTPHYNSPEKVKRLLESIPDRQDIEVFIIDDNSEVKPSICSTLFSETNIHLLNNIYSKGAGGARNTALDRVSGKFVIFADADDEFTSDAFDIFDTYADTDIDIVYFAPDGIKENGTETKRHLSYVDLVQRFLINNDSSLRYKFHVPWSKLIRSKLVKSNKIRFQETLVSNDVIFSLLIGCKAKRITASASPVYRVFESENSLVKKSDITALCQRFAVINQYNNTLISEISNPSPYFTSLIPITLRIAKVSKFKAFKLLFSAIIKEPVSIALVSSLISLKNKLKNYR